MQGPGAANQGHHDGHDAVEGVHQGTSKRRTTAVVVVTIVVLVCCVLLPIVPHKAVAEVSEIGNYIEEVSCCDAWMAERIH